MLVLSAHPLHDVERPGDEVQRERDAPPVGDLRRSRTQRHEISRHAGCGGARARAAEAARLRGEFLFPPGRGSP